MPDFPEFFDLKKFGAGRFTTRPAIAIGTGEHEGGEQGKTADDVLREWVGEWVFEESPELGTPEAVDGSVGRGASGWIAVVEWLGNSIADNVVDVAVGYALAKTLGRLREWKKSREAEGKHGGFMISRGAAALLAAAAVADEFDEQGPLEVEAVEEPSSIAGWGVQELSYVGLEPWIVLLRNMNAEVRYVVVVMPDGEIGGQLRVPFVPFEAMYLHPSRFDDTTGGR